MDVSGRGRSGRDAQERFKIGRHSLHGSLSGLWRGLLLLEVVLQSGLAAWLGGWGGGAEFSETGGSSLHIGFIILAVPGGQRLGQLDNGVFRVSQLFLIV